MEGIGQDAYELGLPPDLSSVHLVFHDDAGKVSSG